MAGPVEFSQTRMLAALSGMPEEELLDEDGEPMPNQAPARVVKANEKVIRKPSNKPFETKNVLKLARERLRDVKKSLKQLAALEQERIELERIIKAATTKPSRVPSADTNVVTLKRTG